MNGKMSRGSSCPNRDGTQKGTDGSDPEHARRKPFRRCPAPSTPRRCRPKGNVWSTTWPIGSPSSTTPNSSSTVAPTCSGCCARDGSLARFFCLSRGARGRDRSRAVFCPAWVQQIHRGRTETGHPIVPGPPPIAATSRLLCLFGRITHVSNLANFCLRAIPFYQPFLFSLLRYSIEKRV